MLKRTIEYLVILLAALSAWLILRIDTYNPWTSGLLTLNIILAFIASRNPTAMLKIVSRAFIGLVFIFSGYVKLVDPLGGMYKFEDYFIALDLDFLMSFDLLLAVVLSVAEVLIGLALLFRLRMRFTSWILLLFMLFFLPLTAWLAITNAVTDCGCFGDVLVLSNYQTFFKNLLFLPFTIIIFINRRAYGWRLRPIFQWGMVAAFALLSVFVSVHTYRHLPWHDFRAWKVGSLIALPQVPTVYLVYQNNATGEKQEWLSADLPWDDSVWTANWTFAETRTVSNENAESNYFSLQDEYGSDMGQAILLNPGYQLLVIAPDVLRADREAFMQLNKLYTQAQDAGVDMAAATASLMDELEPFRHEIQAMYSFYQTDDITLKTVIRSNPGLLLLHDGRILAKWHYNDFPTFPEIRDEFMTD